MKYVHGAPSPHAQAVAFCLAGRCLLLFQGDCLVEGDRRHHDARGNIVGGLYTCLEAFSEFYEQHHDHNENIMRGSV